MEETYYGRRKSDFMLPKELTAEALANLTDSQKINIQIIQNLTSLNTALNDVQHDVSIHQKMLVTGNGEISIPEKIRNIESYIDSQKYWGRFIGGSIIVQTISFFIGIIIAVVRFLPVLEALAKKP